MQTRLVWVAALALLAGVAAPQKPGQKSPGKAAAAAPAAKQEQIDAAIEHGTTWLLERYRAVLARDSLASEELLGQTALSLYTLLKCGVPKEDDTVRALLAHLMTQRLNGTYEVACTLLALGAHDVIDDRPWIEDLARQMVKWQEKHGDWSYPNGVDNLSTTQYGALGLWVAAKDGIAIDPAVWQRLTKSTLGYQGRDGGFAYSPDGNGSTGSMTAAGVGILAICEIELRRAGVWDASLEKSVPTARRRGLEWLAKNFSVTTNPSSGAWLFYYLYGLERLAAFTGVTRIGEHDWYAEGAAQLVATQDAKGCWDAGSDLSETCFALLFLRRATLAQEIGRRGPVTGEAPKLHEIDPPLRLESSGHGAVRIWVEAWNKQLVAGLEWPDERGFGPRVSRVEYVEGERVFAIELGDGAHASRGSRFAIEHVFAGFGKHVVYARAFVNTPKGELSFESPPIEIDAERAWPDWIADLDTELGPDLLSELGAAKVHASSVAKTKVAPLGMTFAPELAIDGHALMPWLADADDEHPEITVTLAKSADANLLRISPATFVPFGAEYLSRAVELEIEINGKQRYALALTPDPRRPMQLVLDKPLAVKRIDVRIVASVKNEHCPLVGIGEIELFLRK